MNLLRIAVCRWLIPVSLALFVAGCVTLPDTAATDWGARRDALLAIDSWAMRGRIALRSVAGDGGQASLYWRQQAERSDLQLTGPFGAGRVDLAVWPDRVTLRDADGERELIYTGADAVERFMQEQLGWSFPVRSARYWVRGILDPAAPGKRLQNAAGELTGLTQHGWEVSLQRFADFDGLLLPDRLVLQNSQYRLRIVVSDWPPFAPLD